MLNEVPRNSEPKRRCHDQLAAVDLGSNSFRLQIGRVLGTQIYALDSLKEPVRLASGLTPGKQLDIASQQRALAALSRFGERLRGFPADAVRVVGTNTLRVAKNAGEFIAQAEKALGFPIEVIAGREEARLIYLGTAHSLPSSGRQRLVVDIGGGSTEFIVGRKMQALLMESLYMGCVSHSLRFFPDGKVNRRNFRAAQTAAAQEIESIAGEYQRTGWHEAIGSSGTARAIADLLELNRLNPGGVGGITRQGLETLSTLLLRAGSAEALKLAGLPTERLPVLAGGIAIMRAVFSGLHIEHMHYADGALRLGVLYDLLGRFHHQDMRESTVLNFMHRYQVDERQAERVRRTALNLFAQATDSAEDEGEENVRLLAWAANLHEIGISIAHSGFHKHGAYVLRLADMPGFSRKDQERLAMLVLAQRGKLEKLPALAHDDPARHLVFCLRLAVALHRSRDAQELPEFRFTHDADGYHFALPDYWLKRKPLSMSVLDDESSAWQRVGSALRIRRDLNSGAIAA